MTEHIEPLLNKIGSQHKLNRVNVLKDTLKAIYEHMGTNKSMEMTEESVERQAMKDLD